jgi:hypothetical protein
VIAAWWLIQPLALFAVSRVTGSSMFVARYLYLGLPGAALAATLAAAYFIPPTGGSRCRWSSPPACC